MSGVKQSCMAPEVRARWMDSRTTHGAYVGGKETSEHAIWRGMLRRKKHKLSGRYYEGIRVCKRWLKYENFIADMGPRPSPEHSVERRHPWGHYTPKNCYWATRSEQQKNKRNTRWWTDGCFTGTLVECAAHLGISKELAHWRMKTHKTFRKGETWRLAQKPK